MAEKKKPVLHELLAVENDQKKTAETILEETMDLFKNKQHIFDGYDKRLEMFDENEPPDTPPERKEVVSTVFQRVEYMFKHLIKYFDLLAQKEATNGIARADLVVDGVVIDENIPATFLLGMESRLTSLRSILTIMPTLDMSKAWEPAIDIGDNIRKQTRPEEKTKTRKVPIHKILVEPTKEHPAQIEKWDEQKPVGKFITTYWSGRYTPKEKAEMIERTNKLISAVKKARQRANQAEVVKVNIAKKMFDYILGK